MGGAAALTPAPQHTTAQNTPTHTPPPPRRGLSNCWSLRDGEGGIAMMGGEDHSSLSRGGALVVIGGGPEVECTVRLLLEEEEEERRGVRPPVLVLGDKAQPEVGAGHGHAVVLFVLRGPAG